MAPLFTILYQVDGYWSLLYSYCVPINYATIRNIIGPRLLRRRKSDVIR